MRSRTFIGAAAVAALVGGVVTARINGQDSNMKPMMMKVDQAMVDTITSSWKAEPKALSQKIIAKYGMPQEASVTGSSG